MVNLKIKVARLTHIEAKWISARNWREQICETGKKYQNLYKGGQPAQLKLASYITYFEGTWS